MTSTRRGLIAFPALAIAVSVSCGAVDTMAGVTSVATSSASVGAAASGSPGAASSQGAKPTTTTVAKGGAARSVASVAAGIKVVRERSAGYKRSLFTHWIDEDGDGCNTREEVLIAESTTRAQVDAYGCKVIAGDWYSPYDGATHTDPSDLDIDHFVPLKEAWDSGAHSWTSARRRQFANDLSDPRSLIAVTAGENRSKGDKDPSNWMPDRTEYWCTYIATWVAVKARWGLTMDESEAGRVRKIAAGCGSTSVPVWGRGSESGSGATGGTTSGSVAPTTTSAGSAPATSPSATSPSVTPTTPTTSPAAGALPEGVPGRFCTPEGARGTYKGDPVVCSRTKADGTPYSDNRARWVRA